MRLKIVVIAAALFVARTASAGPDGFQEALSIWKEQLPAFCQLLALEREMVAVIKESGQAPKEFLSRSADDPDPRVQQVMKITREVEVVSRAQAAKTQRLEGVVATLTEKERQEFQRAQRTQLNRCL